MQRDTHEDITAHGAVPGHGGQTPADRALEIAKEIGDEIGSLEMDRSKHSALTNNINAVLTSTNDDDRFNAALAFVRMPSCGNPRMKALIADLEECLKRWRPGCEASLPSDATIVEVTDARAPTAASAKDGGENPDCPEPESQQTTDHRQHAWDDEQARSRLADIGRRIKEKASLGLDEDDTRQAGNLLALVIHADPNELVFRSSFKLEGLLRRGNAPSKAFADELRDALQMRQPLAKAPAGTAQAEGPAAEKAAPPYPPAAIAAPLDGGAPASLTEAAKTDTSIPVRLSDLRTEKPFLALYPIRQGTVAAIAEDMRVHGFDAAHPLVAWAGRGVVVDGHTRLEAARRAGLVEIPVCFKAFANEDAALAFALHEQRDRRNLQDGDIVRLVETLDEYRERGGDRRSEEARSKKSDDVFGPSSTVTAKLIGTSPAKVDKARAVNAAADPSLRERVEAGELSLNRAAELARAAKWPERRTGIGAAAKRAAKGLRAIAADLRELGEPFAGVCAQIDTLADAMDAAAEKAADPETGVAQPVSAEQRLKHTIAENKIRQAQKLCN